MTREEFMTHAKREIDAAFNGNRNRLMNLVEQAWAEGKRNAETDSVMEIVREALRRMEKSEKPETASAEPEKCESWDPFIEEDGSVEMARCLSTPGLSLCNCGGDKSKCVFYGGENDD